MLSIKEHLILLYCTVDDLLKQQARHGEWRKSICKPTFTYAEVFVIALMESYFRTDTLKRTTGFVQMFINSGNHTFRRTTLHPYHPASRHRLRSRSELLSHPEDTGAAQIFN